ncbi:holo-ACP synthase [Amphritea balenae]|uniref:Holo-[acyl-carrier-protein] synthase n=1 Tax=Amphritea balenae TaxID=452629 RepID=A0A3P1SQF5_9GAMM|nr:holo-ACP synthase [Amphritea balenae]RRC98382.1 holo-ACP synthase [Amphritea balenae]GGK81441.1 holo-[acyl-carrier-protein] synthase [Amphritea balenae]
MILGIGTDLLDIRRIEKALARTPGLAARILTAAELEQFNQSKQPVNFLAKRFAAKEAVVKALGTGIGRGISWQHFEVSYDSLGRPLISLNGAAKDKADELGIQRIHLSYTDETDHVVAFAVAES